MYLYGKSPQFTYLDNNWNEVIYNVTKWLLIFCNISLAIYSTSELNNTVKETSWYIVEPSRVSWYIEMGQVETILSHFPQAKYYLLPDI